ncbi:MAG: hypothetical protein KF886_16585 [Candidatus Hydrogenedentes bacterium]|nr:hypothetical protein [Candidatus Hydrogenedentota bacterium]
MCAPNFFRCALPLCIAGLLSAPASAQWTVVVPEALRADTAVSVAMDDLVETAARIGVVLVAADDSAAPAGHAILLGGPGENRQSARIAGGVPDLPAPPENPEGFRILPLEDGGQTRLLLTSRGPLGHAYGLFWIRDRMLVNRAIPRDIDCAREPAFPVRLGGAWHRYGFGGQSEAAMRIALRNSINWVPGTAILDLVPWDSEPEATINAENREKTRALIAYAHSLHMNYFSFANAFTYHPSLLEKHGATLSPGDPKFWDAIQDKFRMLFTALPELDGIELCNDDISGFWDNYLPFDIMHEAPEADWSYPKRFRTFVKKVHEVVSDEFDKQYFHFTWSLVDHEVHTQPAVFREIFTEEIPTNNFYVMPKVTRADRWWHQPYNPTFNQSPHDAIVLFETMNYYESGRANIFPTFSGEYFQRGLQTFMVPGDNNVRGMAMLANIRGDGWGTSEAYGYVLHRLIWEPDADMAQIARDFCAIHFGPDAAEGMAEIYLMSPRAYKYGLHLEPISYGQFNSHYHMRVGEFPVQGYPNIDHGREHLEWLRRIYLRCKPWEVDTLADIQRGLTVAEAMIAQFDRVAPLLKDPALVKEVNNRLEMTRRLVETNLRYAEGIFAYFDYFDAPSPARRERLAEAVQNTHRTFEAFRSVPGYGYILWGIEELLTAMDAALEDVEAARETLAAAPDRARLEETIARQQARYREVLAERKGDAVKFAHARILVDGRDIVNVAGDTYSIDHIQWDGAHVQDFTFHGPLPEREVTVIPIDIESRPLHPFVLEQPSAKNGYTARIYLDDQPGGNGWMEFDLYYIDERPEALGLDVPWPN